MHGATDASRRSPILPALLSLTRIPLALGFVLLVDEPPAAFAVLVIAALTDVLDGWLARRLAVATPAGAVLDPITDKAFVLTVVVTLVVSGKLSLPDVLWLSTRELGELPLVIWFAVDRRARQARADHPSANVPGKLATVLQFSAIGWALVGSPGLDLWIAAAGLGGVVAALSYWRRALGAKANFRGAASIDRGRDPTKAAFSERNARDQHVHR